jgi:SAM-dependent methyltransferase
MIELGPLHGNRDLLRLLCCTECRSALQAQESGYRCTGCTKEFPLVRGVLRFVDAHNYADSFGYQWQTFSRTQLRPEFSERNFQRKTGLRPEDLRGKIVLDVGCGMGRFADVATRWGATVVGIDLSAAAEVAATNLADRNFVALQADVFDLPFVPACFDCIYSIGVLHHTPDCEAAFRKLPQYLKPGGTLAVWLYSGYNNWYRFSDLYRKVTCHIPVQKLHAFLRIAVPVLYWIDRGLRSVPLVGASMAGAVTHLFPVNRNPDPELRVLDTLDWYSPKYQSKHTYEQVFRWFESCGFESLAVGEASIAVKGRKPIRYIEDGLCEQKAGLNDDRVKLARDGGRLEMRLPARKRGFSIKKARHTMRWLPSYTWQRATRRTPGETHLMIGLADHFEPAILPHSGSARATYHEQEQRLEFWCKEYPKVVDRWRDGDGRPFKHTYFYPAEQYDRGLLDRLAVHMAAGWGEVEIHLHHGVQVPDTPENTRRQLLEFRERLATQHGGLCYLDGRGSPRYAFVHGNFALANSAGGRNCGVDSEMQILSDTGCYAEMTFPPGLYHFTHIAKINSLYECSLPLDRKGAHRSGPNLKVGRFPEVFPLMVEGPLMLKFGRMNQNRLIGVENGSVTVSDPPTLCRLRLWKQAAITVRGRPEWLFIKLQCHGMDPRDREVMLGATITQFLRELVEGAQERREVVHFVSAREMVNIMLAACDGRDGNPVEYRDYRLKRMPRVASQLVDLDKGHAVLKG